MFVESFKLKKGAWHVRLMKYTWNLNYYDFSHICPYFWLSIFNVIIAPVFVPIKFTIITILGKYVFPGINRFLKWIGQHIQNWIEGFGDYLDDWAVRQQEKWEANQLLKIKSVDKNSEVVSRFFELPVHIVYDMDKYIDPRHRVNADTPKKTRKFYKFLDKLKRYHYDEWKILTEARYEKDREIKSLQEEKRRAILNMQAEEKNQQQLEREASIQEQKKIMESAKLLKEKEAARLKMVKDEARKKRREAARITNKARIVKILKVVKPIINGIIWIIGSIVALVGLYWIWKGIVCVRDGFASIPHTAYVNTGKWIGIILIGATALVILFFAITFIIRLLRLIKVPEFNLTPNLFTRTRDKYWENVRSKQSKPKPYRKPINLGIGRKLSVIGDFIVKCLVTLWIPFKWLFKGTALFFRILQQTIKNNCPAIHWDE